MQAGEGPSLYERLGGSYKIAAVVDDFIDRIAVDQRLNANPRLRAASHRDSAAGFKYLVTEWLCAASGGPQAYTGRAMGESHQHLQITQAEWDAFIDDFRQTLEQFKIEKREQQELVALFDRWMGDVVKRS